MSQLKMPQNMKVKQLRSSTGNTVPWGYRWAFGVHCVVIAKTTQDILSIAWPALRLLKWKHSCSLSRNHSFLKHFSMSDTKDDIGTQTEEQVWLFEAMDLLGYMKTWAFITFSLSLGALKNVLCYAFSAQKKSFILFIHFNMYFIMNISYLLLLLFIFSFLLFWFPCIVWWIHYPFNLITINRKDRMHIMVIIHNIYCTQV